jgi:hypothetical protein
MAGVGLGIGAGLGMDWMMLIDLLRRALNSFERPRPSIEDELGLEIFEDADRFRERFAARVPPTPRRREE